MTTRENVLSLFRREGYEAVPMDLALCPTLENEYRERTGSPLPYQDYFNLPLSRIVDLSLLSYDPTIYHKYYTQQFNPGTTIDVWGVAREPDRDGGIDHVRMHHPLEPLDSVEQLMAYPIPQFPEDMVDKLKAHVLKCHQEDKVAVGRMSCTIWETAWIMRGMEQLMVDMMTDEPMAECLLDRLTEISCLRAANYAAAGYDILHIGDDVGTQSRLLMSEEMYSEWLLPRLKKVIAAARAVRPEMLVFYHSCGYIKPLIPLLIEAGIDILDPVQPESMDFAEIHSLYGGAISFNGTLGTQTLLPFGTPEEVRKTVFTNLDIAGKQGGLLPAPTHVVERGVPWENILAYAEACRDYTK